MGTPRSFGDSRHRLVRRLFGVLLVALLSGGMTTIAEADTVVVTPPGTFSRLSVGYDTGCALTAAGEMGCWGDNYSRVTTPALRLGPYREVSTGWGAACGMRRDFALDCWGDDLPKSPLHIRGDFRSVSVGVDLVCGIESNGDLDCTVFEQYKGDRRPTHLAGPFSWVSAGWDVCVVDSARDVVCWNPDERRPRRIAGPFTAVSVGGDHTCALLVDRDIACWGENSSGQAPARIPGPFTFVEAGEEATCAIRANQDLACWGASDPPQAVPGPFASVSVGGSTCALRTDGRMTCWGDPENMQLPSIPHPLDGEIQKAQVGRDAAMSLVTDDVPAADYSTQSSLPFGLELLPDGSIEGIPRVTGTYRIELVATNVFGSLAIPLTIDVGRTTHFDANGDGLPDLAVAAPAEDVAGATDAGAVNIFLGRPDGRFDTTVGWRIVQEDLGQLSERDDRFGAALTLADVTGDDVVDLVIGAPGENAGAGQAVMVPGSTAGLILASPTVLAQGGRGAAGAAESGDGFGSALSVGDGLWVGAPGEDLAEAENAGVATRFPINPLTSRGSVQYRQGSRGVPGTPERGDRFGAALGDGGSVIGVPGEDVGRVVDAGLVVWKLRRSISQDTRGVPGRVERGDRFGTAVTARQVFGSNGDGDNPGDKRFLMAVVGAPGEDVKARKDAGIALLMGETYDRHRVFSEIGPARGTAESGDRFGAAVAFLSGRELDYVSGERVVIGAPGEDIGDLADAGAARTVSLYRYCEHSCGSDVYVDDDEAVTLVQGRRGTPGVTGPGNHFGATVSPVPGVDGAILAGAPGQSVGERADAGAVTVLDSKPSLSHQLDQDVSSNPGEAQAGARFGTLPSR